jgi:hypothetical protein
MNGLKRSGGVRLIGICGATLTVVSFIKRTLEEMTFEQDAPPALLALTTCRNYRRAG